jgi:hypothetical protein
MLLTMFVKKTKKDENKENLLGKSQKIYIFAAEG